MPSIKSIFKEDTRKRLYFYSLLFFALLLPFQFRNMPLTLGLMFFAAVWLVTLDFKKKMGLLAQNRMAGLFLLYALWVAAGALYSDYPREAEKDLILKVPFAAWAVLLGSVSLFVLKDKERLVNAFVYASAVAILFSFGESWYHYWQTGDDSFFFYDKLVHFDLVPPHYFGMYINFVYGVVFYRLLHDKVLAGRYWLSLVVLLLCFLAVVFMAVRMQYVVFLVVNVAVLFFFKNPVRLKTKVVWSVGALVALFLLAYSLPGSRARIKDTVNEAISLNEMVNLKQTNHRKFLWSEGWDLVAKNFWIGTGTGGAEDALNAELENVDAQFWDGEDNYYLRDKEYNLHNSYLQHWVTHGIVGFLIFLAVLFVPLFKKGLGAEGKVFLIVCIFSFLTESMLQRQAGVLFFTFFYSMFFIMRPRSNELSTSNVVGA